jgi:murein DD-endopeptidase MepM/ murein hydrolase activator NlpD
VSLNYYQDQGYLSEAIVNYMALLGWNPGTDQEIFTLEELISVFDLSKVQKSGAIFNEEKLKWVNKEHMKKLPADVLAEKIKQALSETYQATDDQVKKLMPILLERASTFGEIKDMAKSGEISYFFTEPEYKIEQLLWKGKGDIQTLKSRLEKILELIKSVKDSNFTAETVKAALWDYASTEGRGEVLWPMRYALSGKEKSPDPFVLAELLGKPESVKRLEKALALAAIYKIVMRRVKKIAITGIIVAVMGIAFVRVPAKAQTIEELQQKIDENNNTIKQLETEIAQYQTELDKTSGEAKTLQTTVQALDLNSRKLGTDINLTQNKIGSTDLSIQKLGSEISDKQLKISRDHEVLQKTLQSINESDDRSMLEILLTYPDASTFWREVDTTTQFQTSVRAHINELRGLTQSLMSDKKQTEAKKTELEGLRSQLADQQKVIEANKQEKARLLAETRDKESGYKQTIAEKTAQKKAFEKQLFDFESRLKIAIDPKSIPSAQTGILAWPLDRHVITQYFGKTVDAVRLYVSGTHGGIDLAASIGTPVKAAMSGVVTDIEDKNQRDGCQYGYWILIKHPNGLSTLYGHLSLVKVSPGQTITTGDLVGYSGQTGYSTGPHLHFGVYATQGIRVVADSSSLSADPSKSICQGIRTVAADPKAYLDPLSYL